MPKFTSFNFLEYSLINQKLHDWVFSTLKVVDRLSSLRVNIKPAQEELQAVTQRFCVTE
jgi:hypothetical protein